MCRRVEGQVVGRVLCVRHDHFTSTFRCLPTLHALLATSPSPLPPQSIPHCHPLVYTPLSTLRHPPLPKPKQPHLRQEEHVDSQLYLNMSMDLPQAPVLMC